MIKVMKAEIKDAKELLKIQKAAFEKYAQIYGDFDSNPYNMDLQRMEFNINYRFGNYIKIMDDEKIIGGLFAFMLDDPKIVKIAQFYILEEYQHHGIGHKVLSDFMASGEIVDVWYADTIMQEEQNVAFYKSLGFEIIDLEEEHEGLVFATFMKKKNAA
ncbi:MAG: GNAT family N-acetyltransferase [Bacilli bacterium]|nr:GNAT family N-acetyltransferase [Bacilli bacterium]